MVFDSRKKIIQILVDAYKFYLNKAWKAGNIHTMHVEAKKMFLQQLGISESKWERWLTNSPDLKTAFLAI